MSTIDKNNVKQYFDRVYESGGREHVAKFYSIAAKSRDFFKKNLLQSCEDKKVLEYGCGEGSYAYLAAKNGAHVTGIDISSKAIKQAQKNKPDNSGDRIEFLEMDAESLDFENDSYDIVCGTGILHYLNPAKALPELSRVLKPNGKAIFLEPLAGNPAIRLYRRLTPNLRAQEELPLTKKDLRNFKEYFNLVSFSYFHLLSLFAVPFRNRKSFFFIRRVLERTDTLLMTMFPFLKQLCWQVVIILENPKNDTKD